MTSTIHFVGAGPGHPELLTLKAHRLLRTADVILHDDLVPVAILALAASSAQIQNVGKRCGKKKITQAQINQMMIDAARSGLEVVRLKSGDPGIFGRLAEEIAALEAAEVPFEIIPGLTAGIAAAASVGASLTERGSSSRVVFVTRHHAPGNALDNSPAWAGIPRDDTTFVVYMPGRDLSALRRELLDAGFAPDFPAVIVSRASTPDQHVWATTIADLDQAPLLDPPSILLLGRPFARANVRHSVGPLPRPEFRRLAAAAPLRCRS